MNAALTVPPRPLLRHDVAFLQLQDGLLVKAPDATFKLRGAGAYQYVSALLPFLDGHHDLDTLLGDLPGAHGDSVRSLLAALHSRGVVVDRALSAVELPDEVATRFADQRALLAHHGDADEALHRIATHDVLVVAPDEGLAEALLTSLSDNGFGALGGRLTAATGCGGDLPELAEDDLRAADLVVVLGPAHRLPGAVELSVTAARLGTPMVSVLRVGSTVVIGPWQTDRPLLQHAVMRMVDNDVDGAADLMLPAQASRARLTADPALPPGATDLPLSLCAFEIFKAVSGIMPSELSDAAVFFDPERLETTSERLVLHPGLPGAGAFAPPPAATAPAEEGGDPAERRLADLTPYVNDHLGLARRFHDDTVPQIPVKTGILTAPVLGVGRVVGYSVDNVAAARVAALESFAARYSLAVLERTGARPGDGDDLPAVPATAVTTALGTGPDHASWVTGRRLDGSSVRVPAAAVTASPLHRRRTRFRPTFDGLASAPDLQQARELSLVSALQGHTADELLSGRLAVTEQPPATDELDRATERLLLDASAGFGAPATVYRVVGALVPSVLVVAGPVTVLRSGASHGEAARAALVEAVGSLQLSRHTGAEPAPDAQAHLRAGAGDIRHLPGDEDDPESGLPLEDRLARAGIDAVWVDVTAPDLRGVTSVVRTVLHHRAG